MQTGQSAEPAPEGSRAGPGLSRGAFLRYAGLAGGATAAGIAMSGGTAAAAQAGGPAVDGAAAPRAAGAIPPGAFDPIMAGSRFPIGLFWPPPPLQTTLARYQEIADAGFTFSHSNNYLYADSFIQRYVLGMADQVGLQVLVDDPDVRWLVNRFSINDSGGDFTLTREGAMTVLRQVIDTYRLSSSWSIANGALLVNGGSGNGTIGQSHDGAAWTDYTFAFDTTPLATGAGGSYAQAGWAFRAQDPDNAYVWLLNGKTATPSAPGTLTKAVFVGGNVASVVNVTLATPIVAGTSYHVESAVNGSTITTRVDGTLVDTTTDTRYSKGRVGFREAGPESARFDNVKVTDPDGRLLLADDFSADLGKWDIPTNGGHVSFAGLDVFDEPGDERLPTLATVIDIVKQIDPDILPNVNLLPGFDGGAGYAKAAEILKPLELSFDRYPILLSGEDAGYFQNWSDVRAAAVKYGIPSWTFVQSVGYNGHAVPTQADLLWQINISLAYGCKGIQYFTYWTPDPARGEGFHDGLLTVEGNRTPLYAAAKTVNTGYLAPVGKELLPLTSVSAQGAGIAALPAGLPAFAADAAIARVSGGAVVVGRFAPSDAGDGTRWALVANYSRVDPATATVTFGSGVTGVERFQPSTRKYTTTRRTSTSITLAPGAARLLKISV